MYVFGIFVVNMSELAKEELGLAYEALIIQDFLVIPRASGGRVELYSGGGSKTRSIDAFCRKFRGPKEDGYGCYLAGTCWLTRDHHPEVLPGEGKFRAAMSATMREARKRVRAGDFA
jgi:hypothetical protein